MILSGSNLVFILLLNLSSASRIVIPGSVTGVVGNSVREGSCWNYIQDNFYSVRLRTNPFKNCDNSNTFTPSIPCDLTPPTPSDSPHLILWYKNIFGTPIYSVDVRNGLEAASHWRDRSVFGDRVQFKINRSNSSILSELKFNSVRLCRSHS